MAETAASRELKVFKYERPAGKIDMNKQTLHLCRSDILSVSVQVIMKGDSGDTNLHSHTGQDEAWIVIGGKVKFYDKDKLMGELTKNEGIFIPKGAPYWFEPTEEPLEILRISAKNTAIKDERIDYTPPNLRVVARGFAGRPPRPEEEIEIGLYPPS
jgi:mannose-6-phosphate isomerase-like protein (cupin superfamily)